MTIRRIMRCIGRNGEHYLARTRREYFRVLGAGGGAGTITAITVVCKFFIILLRLPLQAETLLFGLNYAASFLVMQGLGFRLATKQPALLAATLIRRAKTRSVKNQIIAITRSQVAATLGNFAFVVASMICLSLIGSAWSQHEVVSQEAAVHAIKSLDPFHSGTIPYAALTGALLWIASLVSGWAGQRTRRIRIMKSVASFGFNLSLAFLLSIVPYAGKSLGIPLDVRHFTLSSGSLTLAVCTIGIKNALQAGLLQAGLGIVFIGFLNFFVSFALSFLVACLTHGPNWRRLAPNIRDAAFSFAERPLHFLLPLPARGK